MYAVLKQKPYNFTTNTLKAYLSTQASSLSAFVISKTHIVAQKSHRRQLNVKVCGSKSAILPYSSLFLHYDFCSNNDNSNHTARSEWIAISFASGLWWAWGFPYYYKQVGPEALKRRSIVSNNSPTGCRSPWPRKHLITASHICFSMPISRGTVLTAEVQYFLGFINIKTNLELCLVDQMSKVKDSTHNP